MEGRSALRGWLGATSAVRPLFLLPPKRGQCLHRALSVRLKIGYLCVHKPLEPKGPFELSTLKTCTNRLPTYTKNTSRHHSFSKSNQTIFKRSHFHRSAIWKRKHSCLAFSFLAKQLIGTNLTCIAFTIACLAVWSLPRYFSTAALFLNFLNVVFAAKPNCTNNNILKNNKQTFSC